MHIKNIDVMKLRSVELLDGYRNVAKKSESFIKDYSQVHLRIAQEGGRRIDHDSFRRTLPALAEVHTLVTAMTETKDVVIIIRQYGAVIRAIHEVVTHLFNTTQNFNPEYTDTDKPTAYGTMLGDIQDVLTGILWYNVPQLNLTRLTDQLAQQQTHAVKPDETIPSCMADTAPDYTIESFQQFLEGLAS
jgi:hypothetical protein